METLFQKLHPLVVKRDVEDTPSWNDSKNENFSVRSLYCSFSKGPRDPFMFSIMWKSWAPIKVSFFAWESAWVRIVTLDQLKRRGWNLLNRCFCAKLRRKPQITCFFFTSKQECCGV